MALDVLDRLPGVDLVPASVQVLGGAAELDEEVAGQVLGFGFAALLAPEAEEGCLILTHDDPCIGAANKMAAL